MDGGLLMWKGTSMRGFMGQRLWLIAAATIVCSCIGFPVRFERIEDKALRTVAAVFTPRPDVAPGDTATEHLSFAGNPVVAIDSIRATFSVLTNLYGSTDTFLDIAPLAIIDSTASLPDSLAFSFQVPDSVFDRSIRQLGLPDSLVNQLDAMVALVKSGDTAFFDSLPPPLLMQIAQTLKLLSQKAYVFVTARSENGDRLRIRAEFTVRYNSLLQTIPQFAAIMPVNENPRIHWLGVYAVQGRNAANFNPLSPAFVGKFRLHYLYNDRYADSVADTILIDSGYTYFAAADSGMVTRFDSSVGKWVTDTSRQKVLVKNTRGIDTLVLEDFVYRWFYENIDGSDLPLDSLLMVSGFADGWLVSLLTPLDTAMHRFRLWADVYDQLYGEEASLNRPRGMAAVTGAGYFRYTAAYARVMGRRLK
jgi:hypothetical protein